MKQLIMAVLLSATSSGALAYDYNGDLHAKCAEKIMNQVAPLVAMNISKDKTLKNLVPAVDHSFIATSGRGDGTYDLWVVTVPFQSRTSGLRSMEMEIGVIIKNSESATCKFKVDEDVSVVNSGGGLGGGGGWGE